MTFRSFLEALISGGKTALLSSGFGWAVLLVYSLVVSEKVIYLPAAFAVVALISALLGGLRGGLSAGTAGWLHGCVAAAFYLLFILIIKSALFRVTSFDPGLFIFALGLLAAGCIGGITGINLQFMRRNRIRKKCGI